MAPSPGPVNYLWEVPTLDFRGKSCEFVPNTGGRRGEGPFAIPTFGKNFPQKRTWYALELSVNVMKYTRQSTNTCCCIMKSIMQYRYPFHRPPLKQSTFVRRRSSRGCKRQEAGIQFRYKKIRAIFFKFNLKITTHTCLLFLDINTLNRFFFNFNLKIEIANSHFSLISWTDEQVQTKVGRVNYNLFEYWILN